MHSRNAIAERRDVRSASHCRVEQISVTPAMPALSVLLQRDAVSLSAIEGKHELRILRI